MKLLNGLTSTGKCLLATSAWLAYRHFKVYMAKTEPYSYPTCCLLIPLFLISVKILACYELLRQHIYESSLMFPSQSFPHPVNQITKLSIFTLPMFLHSYLPLRVGIDSVAMCLVLLHVITHFCICVFPKWFTLPPSLHYGALSKMQIQSYDTVLKSLTGFLLALGDEFLHTAFKALHDYTGTMSLHLI